ncbi:nephrin-like [Branchiostoma floridae x Branchiostoma japonicum]
MCHVYILVIFLWLPGWVLLQSVDECGPSEPESCMTGEHFVYGPIGQPREFSFQYIIPSGFTVLQITIHKPRVFDSDILISLILPPGDPIVAGPYQGNINVTDTGTTNNRTLTLKILAVAADDLDSYKVRIQYTGDDVFVATAITVLTQRVPPGPVLTFSGYTTGVSAGQSLTLTCTSTQGKPPAQVTWWKGDVEQQQAVYSNTPDASNQGDAMSVLTLAVQPANNQETYQCRVSQLGTELERQDLQLNVRFLIGQPSLTGYSGPVTSGSSLNLTCTSGNSNPPATITWTRVGGAAPTGTDQPQTDGQHGGKITSQQISLTNLQARDNGAQFKCTARNSQLGQSLNSSMITINVRVPPNPILTISGYTTGVSAGQSLPLTCTSTQGKPPAQVTWWKGDVKQQQAVYSNTPDDSNQGDAVSVLTLAVQPANNQETYQCRVSQLGTELERQDLQLNVRFMTGAPSLTGYSGPVTSGGSLALTCTSGSSNPPATISWTRLGGAAPTGTDQPQTDGQYGGKITSQQIRLTNLQARDNGAQFKCTATNSQLGQSLDSSIVTIDVRFYAEGSRITGYSGPVTSGSSLTLTCTSGNSNPPATITWTRVGGAAPTGTDQPQTDGQHGGKITSQQIRLTNLQAQDNGAQFNCTVTNSAVSQSEEKTVTIDVQYAPTNVQVTCDPRDLSDLREGDALVCTCTAGSNPAAWYNWTMDSPAGPLPDAAVVDRTAGTVTFSTLDRAHSGEYSCTANNGISPEATSDNITAYVKYPASITSITPPVTVDEYDDVSLTCTADSNPAPDNFSWTMDGTTLTGTTSADGFSLTTTITAISYQQAGTYTCTAGNGIGTGDSGGTNVTVEYYPKMYADADRYPAAIGADVSMQCSAFAVPNRITFTWSKNGTTVTNSSRLTIQSSGETSVLTISRVVEGAYGTYNCTANNGKGSTSTTRTLQPLGPPESPTGLKVLSKDTEFEVLITWTAGFNGGLNTTHTVQLTKAGADQWENVGSWEQNASLQLRTFNVTLYLSPEVWEGPPGNPSGLTILSKNAKFEVRITWTAGSDGGLDTTHTVQLTKAGADQWEDVATLEQNSSEQRRTFNKPLDLKAKEAGDYQIKITARNARGVAWSDPMNLKLEGNQRLYGRMTRDVNWVEALKDKESAEFEQEAALWERNLGRVFSAFAGYEGAIVTQFSQGSVVGDFEAVVAQSESQDAIAAFQTQVNGGSVGDLTVVREGTTISDTTGNIH